jgi:hypothetical protein
MKALGGRMRVSSACVFGGVGKGPQAKQVIRGVDILVATPGRLRDLMEDRAVGLQDVSFLVLDEADRMLDMGFAPEVRRLAKAMPSDRQTVLFSATMPADIAKLANELMRDPVRIEVAPQATTVERIDQKVLFVDRAKKAQLLRDLLTGDTIERAIVFTRTKRGADKVCKHLKAGGFGAVAIHGDKTQGARKQALADFTRGRAPILVATDLAARGIDVDGISHVINYDMPVDAEGYVHRIGRTARAGRERRRAVLLRGGRGGFAEGRPEGDPPDHPRGHRPRVPFRGRRRGGRARRRRAAAEARRSPGAPRETVPSATGRNPATARNDAGTRSAVRPRVAAERAGWSGWRIRAADGSPRARGHYGMGPRLREDTLDQDSGVNVLPRRREPIPSCGPDRHRHVTRSRSRPDRYLRCSGVADRIARPRRPPLARRGPRPGPRRPDRSSTERSTNPAGTWLG